MELAVRRPNVPLPKAVLQEKYGRYSPKWALQQTVEPGKAAIPLRDHAGRNAAERAMYHAKAAAAKAFPAESPPGRSSGASSSSHNPRAQSAQPIRPPLPPRPPRWQQSGYQPYVDVEDHSEPTDYATAREDPISDYDEPEREHRDRAVHIRRPYEDDRNITRGDRRRHHHSGGDRPRRGDARRERERSDRRNESNPPSNRR